jgi:hypothetical protein
MDENTYISQVNASGFPFQLRVEHEIRSTFEEHKWHVSAVEHKWKNRETGEEGFIDIVLEKVINSSSLYYLVIECKRMKEGSCVFIKKPDDIERCNADLLYFTLRHQENKIAFWRKNCPYPKSYISSYCAVPGQGDKNTPMLERICDSLLNSVESIADELFEKMPKPNSDVGLITRVFIPAVVINTELQSCSINPEEISLSLGKIEKNQGRILPVPYIRFQKSFGTKFDSSESSSNLKEINKANQRTIFVIHAQSLKEFLGILGNP